MQSPNLRLAPLQEGWLEPNESNYVSAIAGKDHLLMLKDGTDENIPPLLGRQARLGQHLRWFVRMRWVAAGVALALTVVAVPVAGFLPPASLAPLLTWCSVLVASNLLFRHWARTGKRQERQIVVQVIVDLVVLTGLVNASGGVENPLYIAYVFHVIIPGILLPRRKAYALTAVACILFTLLTLGELFRVLPHYTNVLFPHGDAAQIRPEDAHEEEQHSHDGEHAIDSDHASYDLMFVAGRGLPFVAVMILISYFTTMVSERLRRSEQDLEDAARAVMLEHERLESVVEAAGVGMMLVVPEVTIRWFNHRAAAWLGWDHRNLEQDCPLVGAPAGCTDCIASRTLETGRSLESERTLVTETGAIRYFRHATSPVRDEGGKVVQVVELVEDITSRKALEAEALHAGKLSALGRLAAGVAHEIGNPLSSMDTRLHLMEQTEEPAFLLESVQVLRGQISRIGRIVHGISHFARSGTPEWTVWELTSVLEEAIDIVRLDRRAKEIVFQRNLAVPAPQVRGERGQMSQVFLNLLLNAVEAMPEGGTVAVATYREDDKAVTEISDTGPGMDDAIRGRLFEPFFTTKDKGTGLGLSISYSLVHAHGGTIEVTSEPGKGCRFLVILPLAESATPTWNDRPERK